MSTQKSCLSILVLLSLLGAALYAVLLAALHPSLAFAAPAQAGKAVSTGELDTAALDAYIQAQMDKHGLQGVALAVTQGDQIVYLQGYGSAGAAGAITPQTPMYIGSQSKSFTGLAIAQLIEAGKIDPTQPVQAYLPWFAVADPQASARITINHLLHHASGLSEAGFTTILPDDATLEAAVRALSSAQLTAPVGAKFQYFNLGYDILALIVQTVSGMPYEQYLQQYIFNPLEMEHTFTDPNLARQTGLSQGYSRLFGFAFPASQQHRTYEVGAGYIISTAEDLAQYAIALINAGEYNGTHVISPEGVGLLFKPVNGYGMGWMIQGEHIHHGGANETFRTDVELYLSRHIGIVVLINQGYLIDHYISSAQVLQGVQAIVLGSPPPAVESGWSMRLLGLGILGLVLGLSALHMLNFLKLRTWHERSTGWSKGKLALDIAINFIVPTVILIVVFTQVRNVIGEYRFNWTYQLLYMFSVLPDISILMLVGSLPDYVQGLLKLFWTFGKRKVSLT